MPNYRLEPIDSNQHHWDLSSHVGPVAIRAKDEFEARSAANFVFAQATKKVGIADTPVMPWGHGWLATCTLVEGSEDDDGPVSIIEPAELDFELRQRRN